MSNQPAAHLAAQVISAHPDAPPTEVIRLLATIPSNGQEFFLATLSALGEPAEVHLSDPLKLFPNTPTKLNPTRYYLRPSADLTVTIPVTLFAGEFFVDADGKTYPLHSHTLYRKGGWVK